MITEDRLHHIYGVAKACYNIAKDRGHDENYARKMFAIGWNHDIGYEFNAENHAEVGANLVTGLFGTEAIKTHGTIPNNITEEWIILNYADMTTSPKGESVTMDKRLEDIGQRYGNTNDRYILAKQVIDCLKNYL